jgi:hypothetical protein
MKRLAAALLVLGLFVVGCDTGTAPSTPAKGKDTTMSGGTAASPAPATPAPPADKGSK